MPRRLKKVRHGYCIALSTNEHFMALSPVGACPLLDT